MTAPVVSSAAWTIAGSNHVGAAVTDIGVTGPLTAIAGVYADLAAARTSVNALRGDTEARLAALEAKMDALLNSLRTATIITP